MDQDVSGVTVSMFDYSVESHFRAIDMILKLCGEVGEEALGLCEIEQLTATITFLREWKHYYYEPRIVRFSCETGSPRGENFVNGILLPQFSAVTVPKMADISENSRSFQSTSSCDKDFVLYVGGSVWALDWCPRICQSSDCNISCEYLAVAAHPPESSYHKIGTPLTGRGVIQIWCLLNVNVNEEALRPLNKPKGRPRKDVAEESTPLGKPRGRPRKDVPKESNSLTKPRGRPRKEKVSEESTPLKKPRGRPRKEKTLEESLPLKKLRDRPKKNKAIEDPDDINSSRKFVTVLADEIPEDSAQFLASSGVGMHSSERTLVKGCDTDVVFGLGPQECLSHQLSASNSLKKPGEKPRKEKVLEESTPLKKTRGRPRREKALEESLPLKKCRDRPKMKKAIEDSDDINSSSEFVPALSVEFPEDSAQFLASSGVGMRTNEQTMVKGCDTEVVFGPGPQDCFSHQLSASKSNAKTPQQKKRTRDKARLSDSDGLCQSLSNRNKDKESSVAVLQANTGCMQDLASSSQNVANDESLDNTTSLPKDVALPRLVLCLAHNGKVAWDVKWRPSDANDLSSKRCMGYLAVLLGNGSVEVWEVPSVSTIKVLYSACYKDGTDPRFVKVEPVFRCSKLKFGDRQSIPLTMEWSPSSPHDLILVGCHDGTVALWKFSARHSSQETRPLLCFSADTVPIRTLAWAPNESDPESANVIVTAGHGGLKFWDIRDPYHPLWDLSYVRRVVCSLDWLPDPRCVILSLDDGTLRILSLVRAAYDVPVTGKPFVGTQQQGLHSYYCSPFSIWSVQVSRLTGLVAYCSADGNVLHFQLTAKAVEKDPLRNRAPHFLCGSLTEENSDLTVHTPFPHSPFPMKKSPNEYGDTPRSIRGFISLANQAKRVNDQRVDNQNPASCYEDNSIVGFESENTVTGPTSRATKRKTSKKKKTDPNQESIAEAEEEPVENSEMGENEKGEIEVFPPKDVAMHRVRWNMNKGSERWLCYGGAAGIILSYLENRCKVHLDAIKFCQDILRRKAVDWEPIWRSDLVQTIRDVDLVVTIGGDGTLLQASHFMDDSIPVLGVNSDPTQVNEVEEFRDEFDATRSTGYLCAATAENFEQVLDDILEGHRVPCKLTRISIRVNSQLLSTYALNDVLIAHPCPAAVSWFSYRVKGDGQLCYPLVNCRSSGLRICTAAGSTAAMLSGGGFRMPILSEELQFMVREPISLGAAKSNMHGFIKSDQSMHTTWYSKEGMIYVDGYHLSHSIQHGDIIEISSEAPSLKVFLPSHLLSQ